MYFDLPIAMFGIKDGEDLLALHLIKQVIYSGQCERVFVSYRIQPPVVNAEE